MAFFSDELSAKAFRSESEVHTEGTYTYHLGDTPYFRTVVSATGSQSNLKGDGVTYQISQRGKTGVVKDWTNSHYLSGNSKHGVTLTGAEDSTVLLSATQDSWGNSGNNGGHVTMNLTGQSAEGDIVVDEVSSVALNLTGSSSYSGAITGEGSASVTLEAGSSWTLTGDSSVDSLDGDLSGLDLNGYTLTVGGAVYEG